MKICILGNSVGLRVRPPLAYPNNLTFSEQLREMLLKEFNQKIPLVENKCVGRSLVNQIYDDGDLVINRFPDYYVVVAGITDASTREIPLWYSNLIYAKRSSFLRKIALGIYLYLLKPIRRYLVILRRKRSWTDLKTFEKQYKKILTELIKNTNSRILVLTINQCTERVEKELPGTIKNIRLFNDVILNLPKINKDRVFVVNTFDLDPDIYVPDGIHYSFEGHQVVATRIFDRIVSLESGDR